MQSTQPFYWYFPRFLFLFSFCIFLYETIAFHPFHHSARHVQFYLSHDVHEGIMYFLQVFFCRVEKSLHIKCQRIVSMLFLSLGLFWYRVSIYREAKEIVVVGLDSKRGNNLRIAQTAAGDKKRFTLTNLYEVYEKEMLADG